MEPQDDPEARIRELESSLTDQARASELSAQPYVDPTATTPATAPYTAPNYGAPPYTAPGYGDAFPMSTGGSSSGFRGAWLVLAMFVVGMLILAGGIAFFAISRVSTIGPITAPSSRPSTPVGGSFTDRPSAGQTSPGSESETPTSETEAVPQGGNLSIAGVYTIRTVACNDGTITVSGFSNTVTILGHCASLTVSGSQNKVTVDSADTISASGVSNKVTYHSGSPSIDKSGVSNAVEQG